MSDADIFNIINTRTMVRDYEETPLSEGDKKKILESGIRAPTSGGNEQWFFILVESAGKREELRNLLVRAHRDYFRILKPPMPAERAAKWEELVGEGRYRAPFYVGVFADLRKSFSSAPGTEERWARDSAAAAIENMLLAAWALGIGGCWYGVPLLMEDEFCAFFGIKPDEGLRLVAVLSFGYPRGKTSPRKRRKLEEVSRSV